MVLERPRPTSGRGATASLCCVALYVSWIHLVPHTRRFAALKEAFEGGRPRESQESHSHQSWNYPQIADTESDSERKIKTLLHAPIKGVGL